MKKIFIAVCTMYDFQIVFKKPFEITQETPKTYYVVDSRKLKSEEGYVKHLSKKSYPYLTHFVAAEEDNWTDVLKAEAVAKFRFWFYKVADTLANNYLVSRQNEKKYGICSNILGDAKIEKTFSEVVCEE